MPTLYTIGHSTRALDQFVETLHSHGIQALLDIRSFPMSRRMPHFNRDALADSLPGAGIEYVWKKQLGGRRKKIVNESPNTALRNDSFRNYADYMQTQEFADAAAELVAIASRVTTAYMCAERLWFQCHRMMVSDYLVAHGHEVLHINGSGPVKPHVMMREAQMVDGRLVYNGGELF